MMTYEEFENNLAEKLEEKLKGQDVYVEIRDVVKNNGSMHRGIAVWDKNEETRTTKGSPTVYADELFEAYRNGKSFNKIVDETVQIFDMRGTVDMKNIIGTWEEAKNQIILRVINYECNKDMLQKQGILYRKILDLALTPRFVVEEDEDGMISTAISETFLKIWGVDAEAVYKSAYKNLFEQKFQCSSLNDLFPIDEQIPEECMLYVLTNERTMNGAVALCRPDLLEEFSRKNGEKNFHILPSSIHESATRFAA